jgi:hypothetical protein
VVAVVYNPISHNFQVLVLHTVGLLQEACEERSRTAAANALHLINAVIKASLLDYMGCHG